MTETWIAAVCFVVAMPVLADDPVRVRVETQGGCPTTEELAGALAALDIGTEGQGSSAWVIRVIHPASGATRLAILAPGESTPVEQRSFASRDCEALAQSFALIVSTHFTELGLHVAPPEPPPDPFGSPEDDPPVVLVPPTPTRWEIALAAAGGASIEPLLPSLTAALDLSWLPSAGPFVVRLSIAGLAPTTQGTGTDQVSRWALRPALEAGLRFGDSQVWFQALLGVVVETAVFSTVDAGGGLRVQPGIDLAFATGIHLAGSWWLRIEAAAQAWLTYDRYRIDPDGVVARSPYGSATLSLAILCALDS